MHLRMLRCAGCDLLYASPAPSSEFLATAYRDAQYDSDEEAEFASFTYIKHVSRVFHRLPDLKGALDIGTGNGAFLERLLERGFTEVMGVEPSEVPVGRAKQNIKPLITLGVFSPENYTPGNFSLITSFQTLEHVDNPKAILAASYSLLKPGGAFVTVSHNYQSLFARILGTRSPIFDVEHLQLFSVKSLRRLLGQVGFSGIIVYPIANTYPLHYWLKLLPLNTFIKKQIIAMAKILRVGYLPLPVRAGNIIAIGFRES